MIELIDERFEFCAMVKLRNSYLFCSKNVANLTWSDSLQLHGKKFKQYYTVMIFNMNLTNGTA